MNKHFDMGLPASDGSLGWDASVPYDAILVTARVEVTTEPTRQWRMDDPFHRENDMNPVRYAIEPWV